MGDKLRAPAPCATHRSPSVAAPTRPGGLMGAGGGGNAAVLDRIHASMGGGNVRPLSKVELANIGCVLNPVCTAARDEKAEDARKATEIEALNLGQAEREARAGEYRNRPRVARSRDGTKIDADDIQLERMAGAQSLAYKDPSEYTAADRKTLEDGCYAQDPAEFISDDSTGFQSTMFMPDLSRPECEDVAPVLATRGTEGMPTSARGITDWKADFSPRGVGRDAYAKNHGKVRDALVKAEKTTGKKPVSAGHSLGGATAQLAAVHNPAHISRVVTYSAPGVNEEDAQAFNTASRGAVPVTHYGGTVDGIPNTGERALSGTTYEVDRPLHGWSAALAPATDHTTPLLQSLDETTVAQRPMHWAESSGGLELGRQLLAGPKVDAIEAETEDEYGLPRPVYGVEREAEMDERMRKARHREVAQATMPKGARSAEDVEMAREIMAEKAGRGTVEILHD